MLNEEEIKNLIEKLEQTGEDQVRTNLDNKIYGEKKNRMSSSG